ncbi:hypothetical protein [Fodinicola acaciae]|uniref:hypothetical protein n=1 Tax=Fodinicola acaciae TaxID=2681555 RepID=UPI0013D3C889|nr:hypothetical protein [Fodinicola acaciae]
MRASMVQAGSRLVVQCTDRSLTRLLLEAGDGAWRPVPYLTDADIRVTVSHDRAAFDTTGWEPLTRGAYRREGRVVLHNACGSGFDLHVCADTEELAVQARWRPPHRERLAALLLRSRFHLLARAVLLQYPAMWWAGRAGAVPLHAAAVTVGAATPLLVGPGGVGRSTLLLQAVENGGQACSDNLCVSAGDEAYGVVEPVRVAGGGGRRMAYGRGELSLPGRVDGLWPDRIVVLRRGNSASPVVRDLAPEAAAGVLTAGTYMAGELRRYWAFAATLAMGTGVGPVHPPVAAVAAGLADRLPATEITLAASPTIGLGELLAGSGVPA